MAENLHDRVAIITGASRGIGRETALTLARAGCHLVIAAKSTEEKPNLPGSIHTVAREVEALGRKALPVQVDVRNDGDIQFMVEETIKTFGRVDILVNNAGALWWKPVMETPLRRLDLMFSVNARAAFACAQAVLPHMLERGWGHILTASPPIDLSALPGKVGYLITKFGMTMLVHGLAEEIRGSGVAINAIWPATAIESQATINFGLGGPAMWRKASIIADATLMICQKDPKTFSGRALIDEDFMREEGVTDFVKYRCDPDVEPPRLTAADLPEVGMVPGRG
ncbi:MAG: hypothetical protein GMKNLPBB_02646 [Myxococcota bacterium]|nr:hypothetical protein [Myxococcota bacterium]